MNIDVNLFVQNLETLIERSGKVQANIASEMGITPTALSRYRAGLRNPDLNSLMKIASYFNVSIDWLLGFEPDACAALPADIKQIVYAYEDASQEDKRIVTLILQKYMKTGGTE